LKRILREPMPVRFAFALFHCGDDLLAVFAGVAEGRRVRRGSRSGSCRARLRRRAARRRGIFSSFFTDVGELVDFFVEVAEEIAARRTAAGVRKFFRTGSCARDLRRARSSRGGGEAESDAAGEGVRDPECRGVPCGFRRGTTVLFAGDGLRRRGGLRWRRDR